MKRGVLAMAAMTAIGVWLYVAPGVLDYADTDMAISDRVCGPLVITFSFVAIWEFLRGLRVATRPVAAWLLVAPWVLGAPTDATISTMASAAAVLALSFVEGEIERPYGGGWRVVVRGYGDDRGA